MRNSINKLSLVLNWVVLLDNTFSIFQIISVLPSIDYSIFTRINSISFLQTMQEISFILSIRFSQHTCINL